MEGTDRHGGEEGRLESEVMMQQGKGAPGDHERWISRQPVAATCYRGEESYLTHLGTLRGGELMENQKTAISMTTSYRN